MNTFDFENLNVYKAALEWVGLADEVVAQWPRGRSDLAPMIRRTGDWGAGTK